MVFKSYIYKSLIKFKQFSVLSAILITLAPSIGFVNENTNGMVLMQSFARVYCYAGILDNGHNLYIKLPTNNSHVVQIEHNGKLVSILSAIYFQKRQDIKLKYNVKLISMN